MELNYYEKLKTFLGDEVNKSIINILSPTYALYNNMKIKGARIGVDKTIDVVKIENSKFNQNLANNTKLFFLSLSLFIVSMISIYDIKNMDDKDYVYKILYALLFTIPMYMLFNFLLSKFNKIDLKYKELEKKDKKNYIKFKFVFSKITIAILNVVFILYCLSDMIGINYLENNKIVKLILLASSVYILAISRPIHFFSIFILDILKKLTEGDRRTINGKIRLVLLTIGSVVNIILDYSILFYTLNTIGIEFLDIKQMFTPGITNIVDMIYFTGGFSDIQADNFITKILVMLKDISIFILMTGNLAVYLNIEIEKTVKYEKNKIKKRKYL